MRDNQQGPSVLALEGQEIHHELPCVHSLVGEIAEVADVVHDAGLAAGFEHRGLNVLEDLFLVMLWGDGGGIDFRTVEIGRGLVEEPGLLVIVAKLELLLGELAIHVEHAPFSGDVFAIWTA